MGLEHRQVAIAAKEDNVNRDGLSSHPRPYKTTLRIWNEGYKGTVATVGYKAGKGDVKTIKVEPKSERVIRDNDWDTAKIKIFNYSDEIIVATVE